MCAVIPGLPQVADKVLQLANTLLDDNSADPVFARAAAQLMAASCCLGSDVWAVKVVKAICSELALSVAENRDAERRWVVHLV